MIDNQSESDLVGNSQHLRPIRAKSRRLKAKRTKASLQRRAVLNSCRLKRSVMSNPAEELLVEWRRAVEVLRRHLETHCRPDDARLSIINNVLNVFGEVFPTLERNVGNTGGPSHALPSNVGHSSAGHSGGPSTSRAVNPGNPYMNAAIVELELSRTNHARAAFGAISRFLDSVRSQPSPTRVSYHEDIERFVTRVIQLEQARQAEYLIPKRLFSKKAKPGADSSVAGTEQTAAAVEPSSEGSNSESSGADHEIPENITSGDSEDSDLSERLSDVSLRLPDTTTDETTNQDNN